MINKILKYLYRIIICVIIYFICGISYNMFSDIINNRLNINNYTYYVIIYNGNTIIESFEVREKPIVENGSITFIDKKQNEVTYSEFKYKVYKLKDGNDIY